MGAACPAMADVNGARYAVSGAVDLPGIEPHLRPFAEISQSNVSVTFADNIALAVGAVDPSIFLVVRSKPAAGEPGAFRELWSLADDSFPEALCQFVDDTRRAAYPGCQ